jgi:PPM family protein phosphatase
MRAHAAGLSDVGLQREHNEDSFAVVDAQRLFIVADGMGGHRAGDVASRLASDSITDFFRRTDSEDVTWPFHFDTELSDEENRLLTAIRLANRQIYEHSVRNRDLRGMGTTVVGALFNPDTGVMYVGHVGDSRAYRVREGQIVQLTRDHSLLNDYLAAMPDMPEEQKSELPKNVITRALGMQDNVEIDLIHDEGQPGDVYVLCSDGLSGMVTDEDICQVVVTRERPEDVCESLVRMANENGGEDNVTAVVIRLSEGAPQGRLAYAATQEMTSPMAAVGDAPSPADAPELSRGEGRGQPPASGLQTPPSVVQEGAATDGESEDDPPGQANGS